jgi:hypothetical protein
MSKDELKSIWIRAGMQSIQPGISPQKRKALDDLAYAAGHLEAIINHEETHPAPVLACHACIRAD